MKRAHRAVTLLLVLAAGAACFRTARTPTTPPQTVASLEQWNENMRLVLVGGREIASDERPQVLDDTLLVVKVRRTFSTPVDTIPLSRVTHIGIRKFSVGKTLLNVVLVPVAVLGVLVAIAAASSCPFIYAYDGSNFVPVAEPLGGAVSAGLARTDLSQLENLVLADGRYRLIIANELDETQHLDEFTLLAVDHPQGTSVVADRAGRLHVTGTPVAPVSARTTRGDVLELVTGHDDRWWPEAAGARFRPEHTRDTLTLSFPRPPHDSARLLLHARTSLLGAETLKSMLDLWGGEVDQWYALLDGSAPTRAANEQWVLREELWVLRVWVRERSGWVVQEVAMGGGPYISELQAIALDLTRVEGDQVQVQLHPPAGYWDIDFAALDTLQAAAPLVTELSMSDAEAVAGQDTRALLRVADGSYLVMSTRGTRIEVSFPASPPPPGLERTVFGRTTGFYRVHTDRTAARQAAVLDSLWLEPGFPVRFAERVQHATERSAAR